MYRAVIIFGVFLVGYTVLAKMFGLTLITDFLPISGAGGSLVEKITPSSRASFDWIFTILVGITLVLIGTLYIKFGKN